MTLVRRLVTFLQCEFHSRVAGQELPPTEGFVLCDAPGGGKTVSVLATIARVIADAQHAKVAVQQVRDVPPPFTGHQAPPHWYPMGPHPMGPHLAGTYLSGRVRVCRLRDGAGGEMILEPLDRDREVMPDVSHKRPALGAASSDALSARLRMAIRRLTTPATSLS